MSPAHPQTLPDVTLVCIDTRTPEQALYAMRRSQRGLSFSKCLLIGPQPTPQQRAQALELGIEWRGIAPLRSIGEYSRFILQELRHHVETSHALVVQWDGFVAHPDLWAQAFLEQDYIGPPWFENGKIHSVGNGGFSLRSKRLLEATAALSYDGSSPEDWVICVQHRAALEQEQGLRFAPLKLAHQFGVEQGPNVRAFGFHGIEHFAHEMSTDELTGWLTCAPATLLAHPHTRKLVKSLMACGRWRQALSVNSLRARHAGWDADTALLHLRVCVQILRSPFTSEQN